MGVFVVPAEGIQRRLLEKSFIMATLARFVPLFDRVLVQRAVTATMSKGGIMIPENLQKKESTAKVVAVGNGRLTETGGVIPVSVKVGDEVYLPEYGGTKITMEETDYFLYKDTDFIAKLKPES